MVDNNKNSNSEPISKDGIALIIGGIFILTLVFAAYNYFNNAKRNASETDISSEEVVDDTQAGDINGSGAKSERLPNTPEVAGATEARLANQNQQGGNYSEKWVANDYKSGDIMGGSYTVVRGDTLWEIAEAAYGDGSMWTKILDANSSQIGFLPNGSQALIEVGQVLVLP